MKIKTSELTEAALDWAVAKCEGYDCQLDCEVSGPWLVPQEGYLHDEKPLSRYSPSTLWAQGGPIIEREAHNLFKHNGGTAWCCACNVPRDGYVAIITADGPTPLIAAMRCYVASKLGDEIDAPEELL